MPESQCDALKAFVVTLTGLAQIFTFQLVWHLLDLEMSDVAKPSGATIRQLRKIIRSKKA